MRRMYTTQGIQKLIDNSIDDAFENIKDEEIGSGLLEKIKDKDGHLRFVEGSITADESTGMTQTYGKWSLSGSHLMLVVACELEAGASYSSGRFCQIKNLPRWIMDKIIPSLSLGYVNYIDVKVFDVQEISASSSIAYLRKLDNETLQVEFGGVEAGENKQAFRIQFDLIIDNA